MFNSVKSYFQSDIKQKDNKLMKHDYYINSILRHKFRQIIEYAQTTLKNTKISDKKDQMAVT